MAREYEIVDAFFVFIVSFACFCLCCFSYLLFVLVLSFFYLSPRGSEGQRGKGEIGAAAGKFIHFVLLSF